MVGVCEVNSSGAMPDGYCALRGLHHGNGRGKTVVSKHWAFDATPIAQFALRIHITKRESHAKTNSNSISD